MLLYMLHISGVYISSLGSLAIDLLFCSIMIWRNKKLFTFFVFLKVCFMRNNVNYVRESPWAAGRVNISWLLYGALCRCLWRQPDLCLFKSCIFLFLSVKIIWFMLQFNSEVLLMFCLYLSVDYDETLKRHYYCTWTFYVNRNVCFRELSMPFCFKELNIPFGSYESIVFVWCTSFISITCTYLLHHLSWIILAWSLLDVSENSYSTLPQILFNQYDIFHPFTFILCMSLPIGCFLKTTKSWVVFLTQSC